MMIKSRLFNTGARRLQSAFARQVLADLSGRTLGKFSMEYTKIPKHEQEIRAQTVIDSLPGAPDIIYRGTIGNGEIRAAMQSGYLGTKLSEAKKPYSLDIAQYIEVHDSSKNFYSSSPCRQTVGPYAAGLSLLPCKGYIMVMGLPKVYTLPQQLVHLNEELFHRYDESKTHNEDPDPSQRQRFISIIPTTKENNELTVILGESDTDDWHPVVQSDVMKIIEVCGPGRIISSLMMASTTIAHIREWDNPEFQKRTYAIGVVFYGGPKPDEEFKKMNDRAIESGLIASGHRLITLQDAKSVLATGKLDEFDSQYIAEETHKFQAVPATITIGDGASLFAHMQQTLLESPHIRPKSTLLVPEPMSRPPI